MRQCEKFFILMERLGLAVTYDEVRLKTGYSDIDPSKVSLETRFSRQVPMKIPVVSAAMDTITESRLAIAIAKLGGIGVLHRNLTPEEQREEARRVKFHLSGMIAKPITVREDTTIEEIEQMRNKHGFSFHSFPVTDFENKLIGLLTQNDFDFCDDYSRRASEIMTRDLLTALPSTSINEAYQKMRDSKKKVLPLVNIDGTLAGMYLFSDLMRIKSGRSDMYNVDAEGRLRVAAAVGVGEEALERVELLNGYVDAIVLDTAHGDSANVFKTLRKIKLTYNIDVVAGNISEGESARRLVEYGADGIKVGQGPGSICTTRIVSGTGCPQVTAIYNAARALEGTGVPICADGGIKYSGDIPIAVGAGAHSVMLGNLLAGTREASGEVDFQFGNPVKHYRGMGSLSAMESSRNSRERYRQENVSKGKLVPEGIEGVVPYVGELETVMDQYVGGLRIGMGYVGASDIEDLRQKANFYRITAAGVKESHPHGVKMVREAPNYRREL